MSDNKKNETMENVLEKQQDLVVTPEDCNAALDFWRHFEIPIAPELQAAMDAFALTPNVETQHRLKLEVCKAIATTDHDAFKDDMFSKIVEECDGISFEMQFDKDFEATVAVPTEDKKE